MNKENTITVAIIGAGPRGLSALESLYASVANSQMNTQVKTLLFEGTDQLGNGPVYSMNQPDTNWLNVSERGLTIPERNAIQGQDIHIPHFPSYQDWANFDAEKDTGSSPDKFPLRSHVGKYLRLRFESIASKLKEIGLLEISQEKVIGLKYEEANFNVHTDTKTYHADEVVLTIGHQPTGLDEQMAKWKSESDGNDEITLIENPYPVAKSISNVEDGDVVALRGFGLAMIDVARSLTVGLGGSFKLKNKFTREMIYHPSGKKNVQLVPFSLDGLPMTPKPLSLDLDEPYIPKEGEIATFKERLENDIQNEVKISDTGFLINAITPLIVQKFLALGAKSETHHLKEEELEKIIETWFKDETTEHELIVSKSLSAYESMRAFADMASGNTKISLDYCIGQVWRHCQPPMYEVLSFSPLKDEVIAEIIQLDERLKRYAYGPPVDSFMQMLALVDSGVMTFDFVSDPEILLSGKGWKLSKGGKTVRATSMVNSVLDVPKLLEVNSPLVTGLLNDSLVEPVHTSLGINTDEKALVELTTSKEIVPLCVLGRLVKGTVIGVDSILECLGERADLWAEGLVARISETKSL